MSARRTHTRIASLWLVWTLTAASAGAGAAVERAAVESWAIDAHTTGFLVSDHRAPLVQIRLVFPAGTWSRWGHRNALSSALRISLYDPDGRFRERSDTLNAQLFLNVGSRTSTVQASCLTEDLPRVVRLLKEVLANTALDRSELRRWWQQERLAWRSKETDVRFRADQLAARMVFEKDDPRRRPYEKPARQRRDPDHLIDLRDRLIRLPGRAIGLAGDLTRKQAEELAADLLPPATAHGLPDLESALLPLRPAERWQESTERIANLTQVYFGLVRDSIVISDPAYPAFKLANHVLGGHFYSRLYLALRHDGGETYAAFARSWGGLEPGPLVLASFTRTTNAGVAEEKMRRALADFHEHGITEEERVEAVGYFLGQAPHERQWPGSVLQRRMQEWAAGLPAGFYDQWPQRMAALSLDEINAFVAGYYDPERFIMGRVAPE